MLGVGPLTTSSVTLPHESSAQVSENGAPQGWKSMIKTPHCWLPRKLSHDPSEEQHGSVARDVEMLIPGGPGPPAPGHVTTENDLSQAPSLIMRERCSALSIVKENWHKHKCLT